MLKDDIIYISYKQWSKLADLPAGECVIQNYLIDWQDANGTMYVTKKDQNGEMNEPAFQAEKQGGLRTL